MVRWVVGSILHGVDPLSYFLFQPVLHDWCSKGCGMCYPVYGMVHIKEPLLLIKKSSPCGGSGFPLSHRLVIEHPFTGSIPHGEPISYFLFQAVLHNWCNKGYGIYYIVYGMVHITETLLLIEKNIV